LVSPGATAVNQIGLLKVISKETLSRFTKNTSFQMVPGAVKTTAEGLQKAPTSIGINQDWIMKAGMERILVGIMTNLVDMES